MEQKGRGYNEKEVDQITSSSTVVLQTNSIEETNKKIRQTLLVTTWREYHSNTKLIFMG